MGVSFAPNGIYIGVILGIVAGVAGENLALGVVVAIAGSIAAWWVIVGIEHLVGRGIEAGATAIGNAYRARTDRHGAPQPIGPYRNNPATGYLGPLPQPVPRLDVPGYQNAPAPQWPIQERK